MKLLLYSEKTKKQYHLIPVCANPTFFEKGQVSALHFHPVYHVVFMVDGEGSVETDTGIFALKERDIFVINPNRKHIFTTNHPSGMQYYTINFLLVEFQQYTSTLRTNQPILTTQFLEKIAETAVLDAVFDMKTNGLFVEYDKGQWLKMLDIISQFKTNLRIHEESLQHLLPLDVSMVELSNDFASVLTSFLGLVSYCGSMDIGSKKMENVLLDRILEQLKQNIYAPFHLKGLAEKLNYTPEYLSSFFKQKIGIPITLYLKKLRIQKACEYLRCTSKSVTEISSLLQFCSSNHLCNVFKQEMNLTPREYRKKYV